MRNPFQLLREKSGRSLATRLSLWIVLFAALIFILALGFLFYVSRGAVRDEAIEHATQVLDNTVLRVNGILDDVRIAADNSEDQVYERLGSPQDIFALSRSIVRNNPVLNGCSISFEPDFYPEYGRYFSAYTVNLNGEILSAQEGNDDYQYFYMDWYLLPKLLMQPAWTEPFMDYNPNAIYATEVIASYCIPLTDGGSNFIGSLSLDLSLDWLSETISAVKPYPNSYSIMIGRGGTYLVHPDSTKLFYETIFTPSLLEDRPAMVELGHAMLDGEAGYRSLVMDGQPSYVFFKPVPSTGWSVAIVCPESDVFAGFNRLRRSVFLNLLLGLLLMFLVIARIIQRQLAPLGRLVSQTKTIASGRFDEELPALTRHDEIGQLNSSFAEMQSSLVNYIDELTRTTANKERIEGELRIARDIQMGMVPRIFPAFPQRRDVDLYASMTPAKEVGGDLYDFFIQDEKLYFCIGDVSGKGVPASLFMAVARNLFRVVAQQALPPAEIARQINDTLSEDNEQMMFVTMFLGVIDLQTGAMDFCNCGHNPPVLFSGADRPAKARFLDSEPNTMIGVIPGFAFRGEHLDSLEGLSLLLYTDGLNEAENLSHEQFGNERLFGTLDARPFADAESAVEALKDAVAAFVGEAEASDDLTLLCLRIKKV